MPEQGHKHQHQALRMLRSLEVQVGTAVSASLPMLWHEVQMRRPLLSQVEMG